MANEKTKQIKKEIDKIADTIDYKFLNEMIQTGNVLENFTISRNTLVNISKWALDGKSELEIRKNLELTKNEWAYLCKMCPSILLIMERSYVFADLVVAGTLLQTAIGGYTIKKKMPMKIKDYNDEGRCIGEHVEVIEYDETQPSNPMLLKYLAENKLSEKFGKSKVDNSKEHKEIIEILSPETLEIIEGMDNNEQQD